MSEAPHGSSTGYQHQWLHSQHPDSLTRCVLYRHRWGWSTLPHSLVSPPGRVGLRAPLWGCSQKLSVLLGHWLSNDQRLTGLAFRVFKEPFLETWMQQITPFYTIKNNNLKEGKLFVSCIISLWVWHFLKYFLSVCILWNYEVFVIFCCWVV